MGAQCVCTPLGNRAHPASQSANRRAMEVSSKSDDGVDGDFLVRSRLEQLAGDSSDHMVMA